MGRKRTPDAINELNGNPGKRKRLSAHQKADPPPLPESEIAAPAWLGKTAAKQWDVHAPRMRKVKLLSEVDAPAFAMAMDQLGMYIIATQELNREIEEKGPQALITSSAKEDKGNGINPWLMIQSMSFKKFDRMAAKFGMTPSDRVSISLQPQTDMFDDVPSDPTRASQADEKPESKAAKYLTQGVATPRTH